MQFIKSDISLNFDEYWKLALWISLGAIILSLFLLTYKIFVAKNFNVGTDFAGGTEIQVQFSQQPELSQVREVLKKVGFGNASVQTFGGEEDNEILIRVKETSKKGESISSGMMSALKADFEKLNPHLRRVDEVGPKVGRELTINGIVSMFLAMLGILIYVWFRFTPQFAPGAIFALIHDIIITVGVFTLLNHEFELPIVAALLTIVGYSVNDTIVVYDRIRDNMKKARRGNLTEVVVKSLNETLSRTLLTSLTTFMVVFALFVNSQGSLKDFAFVLMIGILVGTYSSIFIATPTFVLLESRRK